MTSPPALDVDVAELPAPLRGGIAAAVEAVDRRELRAAVDRLQAAYRDEQPARGVIVQDDVAAAAYAGYRLPATFAAARDVLERLPVTLNPTTMVDVGGGSGAAAWAAQQVFGPELEVTVVEQSAAAIRLGRTLSSGAGAEVRWHQADVTAPFPASDLLLLGYVVGELAPRLAEDVLARARRVATTVVVIEPGTPTGFERILAARQGFLDAGWHVVAPCPHHLTCPWAGEGRDWCHTSVRIQRPPFQQSLKGGSLGYEDEKYAYVVATREAVDTAASRVLRHPRTSKGLVAFPVCGSDGEVHDVVVTKRDKERYRAARRTDWGDAWDDGRRG